MVHFLRREKDKLLLERELYKQESKRLKQELETISKELEKTKQELYEEREHYNLMQEATKNHEDLVRKVNEMNILRER